ncbi:UDP-2,3-diacylglucosamine diphosphatase [Nitrogeniibacter mangrovi]|uniref:UDP-2,3-diacylglucosamine diphosphatase n=1 Tax=Nitrogeniibacter mangrovi TaxID=2016596 RepID=A0A6C1B2L9_9RHOO|nr:UDP-2,3-diacylglucosamine diphosphatase [Nitrogeniibacter mangrovi]QID17891.1 UDP-2,3-diacylglucosamine diphosphatase [Nitrogeniibacter mangrovi]
MQNVRAIFISDVHLGTRGCQADRLLDFLRHYESEYLYLVGDIVDFWAMKRSIHWSPTQNTVIQKVLRRARKGCQVIFVPGNHDEALREYSGIAFGDIQLINEVEHTTADGRRFLLLHGDEFDQVTRYHKWVAVLGDIAYNTLVWINTYLSRLRRRLGRPGYWSLAGYAKRKVKSAVSFIFDFEDSVIHAVRERGVDGVICGHIHAAAIKDIDGITYVNCGDWVDSCTGIIEHMDGRLELVEWIGHAIPRALPGPEPETDANEEQAAPLPAAASVES